MFERTRIIIAGLAALAVLIAGIVATTTRSPQSRAQADVLITPVSTDPGDSVAGVDTLSRGTAVATYAEALRSAQVVAPALERAGITEAARGSITITTQVIAGTSIVRVTAESRLSEVVGRAADAVAGATPVLGGYSSAFRTQRIDASNGESSRVGPSGGTLFLLTLLLAIGTGAGVYYLLGRGAYRRSAHEPPATAQRAAASSSVVPRAARGRARSSVQR